jgi:hypothetical protein
MNLGELSRLAVAAATAATFWDLKDRSGNWN